MIRYKAFVTQRIATYLRNRIALAISKTSYEDFYSKNSQKYISWFTSDIDQIEKKRNLHWVRIYRRDDFCSIIDDCVGVFSLVTYCSHISLDCLSLLFTKVVYERAI